MEDALRKGLGTKLLEPTGSGGGGCISSGSSYLTDDGIIFVKVNNKKKARTMFVGEEAGLNEILKTKTIRVPRPIRILELPSGGKQSGFALVMEHLDFDSGNQKTQEKLGEDLARLHLHNISLLSKASKEESRIHTENDDLVMHPITEFGFDVPTCCGYLPLDNSWRNDWATFYIRQRLQPHIDGIIKGYGSGSRDLIDLWNQCLPVIEQKLNKVQHFQPSLLHGDLWSGNFASCQNQPVAYDPAAFYGHSEFDLGIGYMFGGFRKQFYESYHRLLPQYEGFSQRKDIYELFHHLNHWRHFGNSYKSSTLNLLRTISATR